MEVEISRESKEGMAKGRTPCHVNGPVKRGAWSPDEDMKLISFMMRSYGHHKWRVIPKLAGLQRCGKSCRLRWMNHLRPDIKRGNFTSEEVETIIRLHNALGNKWSQIASYLPGRTNNEIKNVWNTYLRKGHFPNNSSSRGNTKSRQDNSNNNIEQLTCKVMSMMQNLQLDYANKVLNEPNGIWGPNNSSNSFSVGQSEAYPPNTSQIGGYNPNQLLNIPNPTQTEAYILEDQQMINPPLDITRGLNSNVNNDEVNKPNPNNDILETQSKPNISALEMETLKNIEAELALDFGGEVFEESEVSRRMNIFLAEI